ncbi:MAG: T9SS type A sorting domain-containing protein [Chitinophagales bacterium]|nr:T9SS type A sorting domain-containing protein [Chitinophagales bacterium]
MFKIYSLTIALFAFNCYILQTSAQGTFTQVHQILQTNCAGASCHQYGGNPSFDVTGSESTVYNQLVNINPVNPYAKDSARNKLIAPGYPDRSYLFRKIAHGLNENNSYLALKQPHEGMNMPDGGGALSKTDIELIRQWILFGAPLNGTVVDTALINKYYSGKGIDGTYPSHNPPAPGTGYQFYVGKIFIPPATETEYYIKHDPRITENLEVDNIVTMMPAATHHFVLFTFLPGQSGSHPEGLRPLSAGSHGETGDGIGSGPNYREFQLPAGTAYFWPANSVFDFNLHIRNNNPDSVLAADLYVNVLTQPLGTATDYMRVRNFPVFTISIPQDGQEHEFEEAAIDTNETKIWKIWMLYSHTHRYGTDYDIWLRNLNGTKGAQIYEGFYNQDYTFNQGFYAWGVDVAIRYFTPFLEVDPRLGFVHRARYKNTSGPDPVTFGDTSLDEMMVMGFQYVYGDDLGALPSAVDNTSTAAIRFNVFPNPASRVLHLNYILPENSDVSVEMTNILGEHIVLLEKHSKAAGNYLEDVYLDSQLSTGVYQITLNVNGSIATKRIVIE